jgi:hypothetical protein
VVGLGSKDRLDLAHKFVRDTAVDGFPMFYDDSGRSWAGFGVISQPYFVVLAKDGTKLGGWFGSFKEDKVLELIGA